jgi:uncharacterized membrane protein HdeD (DUF308 family)
MQCNIDARGKRSRLISGVACTSAGALLLMLAFMLDRAFWPMFLAGVALLAAGLFQVFEARKGWCALRALGIKTPV